MTILTQPTACTLAFFFGTFSTPGGRGSVALITLKTVVLACLKVIENEFFLLSFLWIRTSGFLVTEVFSYMILCTARTLPSSQTCNLGLRLATDSLTRHFLHWCHNSQAGGNRSFRNIFPTLCLSKQASDRQTRPQDRHPICISVSGQSLCWHTSQEIAHVCSYLFL